MTKKIKDKIGLRYGKLLVISKCPELARKKTVYECLCDCGKTAFVSTDSLTLKETRSKTRSCGCLHRQPKDANALPGNKAAINRIFRGYINGAKARGYEWKLSLEEFVSICNKNCYYCGLSPINKASGRNSESNFIYSGIDRIDNSIGYILENCVPACKECNFAKRNRSDAEFTDWFMRINRYRNHRLNCLGNTDTLYSLPPEAKYNLYGV